MKSLHWSKVRKVLLIKDGSSAIVPSAPVLHQLDVSSMFCQWLMESPAARSLEILSPCSHFVRSNLSCELTLCWWAAAKLELVITLPVCSSSFFWTGEVVNVLSDRLLKNDRRHSRWLHFEPSRLFSLCRRVPLGAWWRSPHRSMTMCSHGAADLRGSRWLWSRLVCFHCSQGKLHTRTLCSAQFGPVALPWKNTWHRYY